MFIVLPNVTLILGCKDLWVLYKSYVLLLLYFLFQKPKQNQTRKHTDTCLCMHSHTQVRGSAGRSFLFPAKSHGGHVIEADVSTLLSVHAAS